MRILGYDVVIMEKDCLEKYDLTSACSSESACCKNDSFPAISLFSPSSQTHSPKKKREKKRKKEHQRSTNGRGEETIIRYFFCLCRKWGSKSDCARLWDQMYWNASSTSLISSICFSAVMWVQRSAAAGQEGVECAKATSDLRALDILKVKPNHLFWKHSYSFKAPSWKPGSSLKGQGDSLSQIKHLILLKSSCERCLCIVCSFPVGISW